ncbi:MAG TPA: hypothetical protein VGO55_05040 [Allosphingosinicella sp.]|nr:hypothetical protein [Allosphingosinicella sp.]
MKITMTMLTAATFVLATGCSRQPDTANNAAVPTNEANSAGVVSGSGTVVGAGSEASTNPSLVGLENQASVASVDAGVDRAFVIGRWGPDAACSQVVEFHADGSVTPPEGASWTLAGNRLTMTLPGRPVVTTTLTRIGQNMTATRRDDTTFTMFRCR